MVLQKFNKFYENKILVEVLDLWSWLPGILFTTSHIIQIERIFKSTIVQDIDIYTFLLFFVGNLSAYIFSEKYWHLKTILAYIFPAILEIYIVAEVKRREKKEYFDIVTICIGLLALCFTFVSVLKESVHKYASLAGTITAISVPIATMCQLYKIIKKQNAHGVSANSWWLIFIGNIGNYILIGKYTNWKNIIAFLGSAVLDLVIIFLTYYYQAKTGDKHPDKHLSMV